MTGKCSYGDVGTRVYGSKYCVVEGTCVASSAGCSSYCEIVAEVVVAGSTASVGSAGTYGACAAVVYEY